MMAGNASITVDQRQLYTYSLDNPAHSNALNATDLGQGIQRK